MKKTLQALCFMISSGVVASDILEDGRTYFTQENCLRNTLETVTALNKTCVQVSKNQLEEVRNGPYSLESGLLKVSIQIKPEHRIFPEEWLFAKDHKNGSAYNLYYVGAGRKVADALEAVERFLVPNPAGLNLLECCSAVDLVQLRFVLTYMMKRGHGDFPFTADLMRKTQILANDLYKWAYYGAMKIDIDSNKKNVYSIMGNRGASLRDLESGDRLHFSQPYKKLLANAGLFYYDEGYNVWVASNEREVKKYIGFGPDLFSSGSLTFEAIMAQLLKDASVLGLKEKSALQEITRANQQVLIFDRVLERSALEVKGGQNYQTFAAKFS